MILVVGAGIAGLASALALTPFGDVLVVERRLKVEANRGAGIQLSPNAVKALAAIGAREAVEAQAGQPAGLIIKRPGRKDPVAKLDYGAMEVRFGAPYLTISRAALHAALLDAVAQRPRISVRYEVTLAHLREEDAAWRCDGIDDAAQFVVAADGVGSRVRQSLVGDAPAQTPAIAWRGSDRESHGPWTELTLAPEAHLVRYALADGRDNLVLVTAKEGLDPQAMASPNAERATGRPGKDGAGHPLGSEIAQGTDWTPWPINVRPKHHFGRGTLAFAGDAAHAMEPFLAQGGAMALEDAAVLGAFVAQFGLTARATEAYGTARAPRTQRLAARTAQQGSIYHMSGPTSLARDVAMRALGPRGMLRNLEWIYAWDPPKL